MVDDTVDIPYRLHIAIIGPKGKLVRAVMEECGGVRINFPSSDSKTDTIKLHGPKDDVEKAKRMLQELADEQVRERGREGGEGGGRERGREGQKRKESRGIEEGKVAGERGVKGEGL